MGYDDIFHELYYGGILCRCVFGVEVVKEGDICQGWRRGFEDWIDQG